MRPRHHQRANDDTRGPHIWAVLLLLASILFLGVSIVLLITGDHLVN